MAPATTCPPPTPFIGRDEEISEVITALNDPDCRLLSLIGPGGMGKTRLAIEVGLHQVENFRHGVRFIGLAPLNTRISWFLPLPKP